MKPVIIIDAGHGGRDPGGGSNQYWLEKDKNLEISLYQAKRFTELGIPVSLTRKIDKYIGPVERAKIVRESEARYCISNHINAGGGDGAEVIYSIYGSEENATKIANTIKEEGQNIRRTFVRTLPNDSKKDFYFMHRNTGVVETFIIEYGFADSRLDDVQQLKSEWTDYAEAVVKSFCKIAGYEYKEPVKADWKTEKIMTAGEIGYLHNPEQWTKNPDQPVPMWAVCSMINQMYRILKG